MAHFAREVDAVDVAPVEVLGQLRVLDQRRVFVLLHPLRCFCVRILKLFALGLQVQLLTFCQAGLSMHLRIARSRSVRVTLCVAAHVSFPTNV